MCVMEWWSLSGIHTSFACYLKHSIFKCTENGECWVLWLQKGQGGGGDTFKVLVGLALVSGSESLLNNTGELRTGTRVGRAKFMQCLE